MAIFAHTNNQEQATKAVRAAICIMNQLDFRNDSCGWQSVETGIGINTGKIFVATFYQGNGLPTIIPLVCAGKTIMGVVGTETRMEPTVLGDAVNLASRYTSIELGKNLLEI